MAYPFSQAPTLREFIDRAKAQPYNAELKHTATIGYGPKGPVRFTYLWIDSDHFVPLPDMPEDGRLAPDIVDHFARRLGIPTKVFMEGFEGFQDDQGEHA